MRNSLILTLFIALTTLTFGQKMKSENHQVSLKTFEKQEIDYFGKKQLIYFGILKVKSKDNTSGEYRFYLPLMDGKFTHLTIRNMEDLVLLPRLYYNEDSQSFIVNIGQENEQITKAKNVSSIENIVLSGSIIWLEN